MGNGHSIQRFTGSEPQWLERIKTRLFRRRGIGFVRPGAAIIAAATTSKIPGAKWQRFGKLVRHLLGIFPHLCNIPDDFFIYT